jgi:hypothetical protein
MLFALFLLVQAQISGSMHGVDFLAHADTDICDICLAFATGKSIESHSPALLVLHAGSLPAISVPNDVASGLYSISSFRVRAPPRYMI